MVFLDHPVLLVVSNKCGIGFQSELDRAGGAAL